MLDLHPALSEKENLEEELAKKRKEEWKPRDRPESAPQKVSRAERVKLRE